MRKLVFSAASWLLFATAPPLAATSNYDCSKAGNANKAACKGAVPVAAAAPALKSHPMSKPVAVAKPAATPAAATASRTIHYDCSKAGNANKAQCKGAAPVAAAVPVQRPASVARPAPAVAQARTSAFRPAAQTSNRTVAWTTKTGKVLHYDCSKAGNATKQACK
jgi:large subunit ribosomal protein L22e/Meckel syndrome type 1 protein